MLVAHESGLSTAIEAGQTSLVVNLEQAMGVGHAPQYAHRQRTELVGSEMDAAWALPERHSRRCWMEQLGAVYVEAAARREHSHA